MIAGHNRLELTFLQFVQYDWRVVIYTELHDITEAPFSYMIKSRSSLANFRHDVIFHEYLYAYLCSVGKIMH